MFKRYSRLAALLAFVLVSIPSHASIISQKDFGAGSVTSYLLPTGSTFCKFYMSGPGAGGGAGSTSTAGGGGGSGARALFITTGSLGGMSVSINLPIGGLGGVSPGGNGTAPTGHATLTWPNGFQFIAGSGAIGYGANDNPGPGGMGGNVATNSPDQGGTASRPIEWTSFGQFNLGSTPGMDGTLRKNGRGGNEGDTGGGGSGGWWLQNGGAGQGAYLHIECYN